MGIFRKQPESEPPRYSLDDLRHDIGKAVEKARAARIHPVEIERGSCRRRLDSAASRVAWANHLSGEQCKRRLRAGSRSGTTAMASSIQTIRSSPTSTSINPALEPSSRVGVGVETSVHRNTRAQDFRREPYIGLGCRRGELKLGRTRRRFRRYRHKPFIHAENRSQPHRRKS